MIYCHQIQVGDLMRFSWDHGIEDWWLVVQITQITPMDQTFAASYLWYGICLKTGVKSPMFQTFMKTHMEGWYCFRDGKEVKSKRA